MDDKASPSHFTLSPDDVLLWLSAFGMLIAGCWLVWDNLPDLWQQVSRLFGLPPL
jgi:hypothetical protein